MGQYKGYTHKPWKPSGDTGPQGTHCKGTPYSRKHWLTLVNTGSLPEKVLGFKTRGSQTEWSDYLEVQGKTMLAMNFSSGILNEKQLWSKTKSLSQEFSSM